MSYVVDKAPIKHGKWTPGSHIPIFDPSHMKTAGVDVLLLFSWNLAKEILEQEKDLRSRGLRFPQVTVTYRSTRGTCVRT